MDSMEKPYCEFFPYGFSSQPYEIGYRAWRVIFLWPLATRFISSPTISNRIALWDISPGNTGFLTSSGNKLSHCYLPYRLDAKMVVLLLIVGEQWKLYSFYFAPEANG
jgi:hypothetical protein